MSHWSVILMIQIYDGGQYDGTDRKKYCEIDFYCNFVSSQKQENYISDTVHSVSNISWLLNGLHKVNTS